MLKKGNHFFILTIMVFIITSGCSTQKNKMINRGYHRNFTLGILAAGGTLGILIPPSIPMIVYAFVVEESVLSMFLSGIGPAQSK